MNRRHATLTPFLAICATLGTIGATSAPAAAAKTPKPDTHFRSVSAPTMLTAQRVSDTRMRLSWHKSPGAVAYRVFRDHLVVSETHRLTMIVAVQPGRAQRFTVAAVTRTGKLSAEARPLRLALLHRAPNTPQDLSAVSSTADSVYVSWNAVAKTTAPIQGYRVYRDGAVVGQTSRTQMLITNLMPLHHYSVSVAAVDTQGYVSAASSPVTVNTQRPAATTGSVRLWINSGVEASIQDFEAHYAQVKEVYPTYFSCASNGLLTGTDNAALDQWAQERGVAVLPRLNCQTPSVEHQILTDPTLQQSFINQVVGFVTTYGYQGVNLDFEGGAATDENAYTAFVGALADALHANGAELSIDVRAKINEPPTDEPTSQIYDYAALANEADEIIVMGWGLHWTTSGPGPDSPIAWFTQIAQYAAAMPNPSRFYLALGSDGLDWGDGGGPTHPASALTYPELQALITSVGAQPTLDPISDEMTFSYVERLSRNYRVVRRV